eukprot:CAMPEP_0195521908 /NCGR_PEP_ID=MMETSP0794_2-20130614/19653_1 /TAXON_ID=515487 /ORGANISM="Stephanopyxis turris, Strain CCMP 815" /LENGTH=259 /DNA_ID=CAMNT_0040651557 /DNA_START=97 /DNA_END=876 /DNA_ORIENTATION=+
MVADMPNLDHLSSSSCLETSSYPKSSLLSKPRTIFGQYWSSFEGDSNKQGNWDSSVENSCSGVSRLCILPTIDLSSASFTTPLSSFQKYSPTTRVESSVCNTGKSQLAILKGEEENAEKHVIEFIADVKERSLQPVHIHRSLNSAEMRDESKPKDKMRANDKSSQRRSIFCPSSFSQKSSYNSTSLSMLSCRKARSAPSFATNTKIPKNLHLRSSFRSKKPCSQPNLRSAVSFNPRVQVVEYEKWKSLHENEGWWRLFV